MANAQKATQQSLAAENITNIVIDADEVFSISIKASKRKNILITTRSQGEYFQEIRLKSHVENHTLFLASEFREILTSGYDKLSAHKVYSFQVKLEIPKNLEVLVFSNIASVEASGDFKTFEAELKSGSCSLKNFSGNAILNTYNGNIFVKTAPATIEATSRNGKVTVPTGFSGKNHIRAKSIHGNILVEKIE